VPNHRIASASQADVDDAVRNARDAAHEKGLPGLRL
jgi:hypothetical protein